MRHERTKECSAYRGEEDSYVVQGENVYWTEARPQACGKEADGEKKKGTTDAEENRRLICVI